MPVGAGSLPSTLGLVHSGEKEIQRIQRALLHHNNDLLYRLVQILRKRSESHKMISVIRDDGRNDGL